MTETCVAEEESLPLLECAWGRQYDECKAVRIYGANSSLFAEHPSLPGAPGVGVECGGRLGVEWRWYVIRAC